MQRYEYKPDGGAFRLELSKQPTRTPGPGEVRVRVRATSLNYRDLITLK